MNFLRLSSIIIWRTLPLNNYNSQKSTTGNFWRDLPSWWNHRSWRIRSSSGRDSQKRWNFRSLQIRGFIRIQNTLHHRKFNKIKLLIIFGLDGVNYVRNLKSMYHRKYHMLFLFMNIDILFISKFFIANSTICAFFIHVLSNTFYQLMYHHKYHMLFLFMNIHMLF